MSEATRRDESGFTVRGSAAPLPFTLEPDERGWALRFTSEAGLEVEVRRPGVAGWRRRLSREEIELDPAARVPVRLRFRAREVARVSDGRGRRWTVAATPAPAAPRAATVPARRALLGAGAVSGGLHLAAALMALLAITRGTVDFAAIDARQARERARLVELFGEARATARAAFSGVSLRALELRQRAARVESELRAMSPLERLRRAAGLMRAAGPTSVPAAAGARPPAVVVEDGDARLEQALARVGAAGRESGRADAVAPSANVPIPAAETAELAARHRADEAAAREQALRVRLDALRPRLTAAYDEALRADPGLSVTVGYLATVDAQGRLGAVELRALGGAVEGPATRLLLRRMREAFEGFEIGRSYAGAALRGEQVFVR
jgi:hypothetical protein